MRLLWGLLVLLFVSSAAYAQAVLTVPEINSPSGSAGVIPILLENGDGLVGVQFDLSFDPSVLSITADSAVLGGDRLDGHDLDVVRSGGKVRVIVFSSSLRTMKSGRGVLVQIVAQVSPSADAGGSHNLAISQVFGTDALGNPVGVAGFSGALRVSSSVNVPQAGQNELFFPHVVNGAFQGGSFQTTVVLVNSTDAPADAQLTFAGSGNTPFPMRFTDGTQTSVLEMEVPARGSVLFRSDGTGGLASGFGRLISSVPLAGTLLFQINSGNQPLTEVGVAPSPPASRFGIPVLKARGLYDTGIALVNPTSSPVTITITAKSSDGSTLASATFQLTPNEHMARFSGEMVAAVNGLGEFNGSFEFVASSPVSAVALKQTGYLLTSFPVTVIQ